MHPDFQRQLRAYGLTVLAAAAAVALRWLFDPWLDQRPLVTVVGAAAVAAWLGLWPGLFAAMLGGLGCGLLFLPRNGLSEPGLLPGIAADLACSALVLGLGAGLADARRRARESGAGLASDRRLLAAERAAREAEARLAAFADHSPAVIFLKDLDGRYLLVNRRFEDLAQATGVPGPYLGRTDADLWPAQVAERFRAADLEVIRSGRVRTYEEAMELAGQWRTGLSTRFPLQDEAGGIRGVGGISLDITDRKAAEERLAAVLASIDDHLVCYDRQWRYTYVNEHAARVLGKTREELLGRSIWELFPDAVGNQYYRELHQAIEEQRAVRSEHYYAPFDTWFENFIYPTERGVTVFSSDISERKRAEQALRQSEERLRQALEADLNERRRSEQALREADQRKDEFLAMLGHELRNPLAPIRTALQILRRTDDAEERARVLAMCERQVRHLVRLVDDLLEVSRITRGNIELHRERVALALVVEAAVETSKPLIEAGCHRLTIDLPAEPLLLDADPVRLAQVIANLLNNSARYTEEGGDIRLSARREGGEVVLAVRDDGVGIAPDMLPRVFDLFTQADTSLRRTRGGLGIGLTLVRRLVELHGGSVVALSDGPGRGSELVVRLPAAAPADTADPSGDGVSVPPVEASGGGRSILVVDDNRDAAETLGLLLQLQGHEVQLAHDGVAALEAARGARPQVVLLDIGLPGLDGYEVARRLRREPGAPLCLIALTGYGQDEDRRRAREAGFDHHLVKPVNPEALNALLAALPPAPSLPGALSGPAPQRSSPGGFGYTSPGEG